VILYSGGLDSFCLAKLVPDALKLFVRTGTTDNEMEYQRLTKQSSRVFDFEVTTLPLVQWELKNKIIPLRNCFFVLTAAQYGSLIYLGATIGDTTKDKDHTFAAMMEAVLNYFGTDTDKTRVQERPFKVELPFKHLTKTEILHQYLQAGHDIDELVRFSRSCYSGMHDLECGQCRSCLRKYVAFVNNGVADRLQFRALPARWRLDSFLQESINKKRHKKEIQEIRRAICGVTI